MEKRREYAKTLRGQQTREELRLWYLLRGRRFHGFKFRRQMPIGNYIVDFACYKAALIIELDGGQHAERVRYDETRTGFLERQGWLVLRFWNNDFRNNEEGVLLTILRHLQTRAPHPGPLPQGEGEGRS
ncbi:endonuclease domain-containing protein [Pseudocitrobacter faecalis]|uniref:endonuclease domain-containing protein n=2 Tax=Pseudocitrobacter faecalis TaxID=1398493 RepID=UPI003BA00CD7